MTKSALPGTGARRLRFQSETVRLCASARRARRTAASHSGNDREALMLSPEALSFGDVAFYAAMGAYRSVSITLSM